MTEHDEQSALVDWARLMSWRWPCLRWLHAIPNGASLSGGPRTANRLKAEGMTPGICDLFLPFAARGYHGLYIEMKAPGRMSAVRDGQRDFMEYVESAGYLAQVHDSFETAKELIEWYLGESDGTNKS